MLWSWPVLLKISITAAAPTHISNQFHFTAEIAMVWKILTVQPLFKGCDTIESNSCRPRSMVLCVQKVLEKTSHPLCPVHDVQISVMVH